ncbi:uncharacterized protein LOC130591119 [Beta vulgaris subsp. vulgaris]|uniref:uncharacterized protein LOC130591119 n=1 Tax=Beta vulgaris subsp. vulgaris TaxID=3555 RepID=UPI00053F3292|nr:uncharacterized protein LOC130591119 [Beta vulgaris subsp. vulgaris]
MSDRQTGVDPSLDVVWPKVPRRYRARHLCKNFKSEYCGLVMHKMFWTVVKSYSAFSFKKSLLKLQSTVGLGAVRWFTNIGPLDRWARWKYDPTLCNDECTNNFVESFTSSIGADRCYPILTLLEGSNVGLLLYRVRRVAMVRHDTRQHLSEIWVDRVCPNIREKLRVIIKDSRTCHAYPSGRGVYEIHDDRSVLHVSLTNRACICGRWQIIGIPCKHGVRAILDVGKEPLDFVSEWFSVLRYKQAYRGNISPIPDQEQWPEMDLPKLTPPAMKRGIGRPSRNIMREEGEQQKGKRNTIVQCKKCGAFGHNSKTCKLKERATGRWITNKRGKGKKKGKTLARGNISQDEANDHNLIDFMMSQ